MTKAYILSQEDATDKQFGQWIKQHREKVLRLGLSEAAELLAIPMDRLIELESGRLKKSVTKLECLAISGGYNLKIQLVLSRALSNF